MSLLSGTHIWVGNSSLLGVRRWMPQLICGLFLFGVAGLFFRPRRSGLSAMVPLIAGYATFLAALAYYATQVFQQTGTSVIQGWYLTMFIPVEAILFVAGARGWFKKRWNWLAATLAVFLFALLVYSALFVALPYYAGKPGDFILISKRLLRFTPAVPLWLPWLALSGVAGFAVFGIARMSSR